jgi:RHS repeat-associated protein
VIRRYHWGADLSGNREGAGGVGGLLAITSGSTSQLPLSDGNGNIVGTIDAATGQRTAEYEYGPFGEPLRANGPMANANPFRFSTKYTDNETGLVYYGYRFYNSQTGRWLSKDPINEIGFRAQRGVRSQRVRFREERNLYAFISNASVNFVDILGLSKADGYQCCDDETIGKGEERLKKSYEKAKKDMEGKGRPHKGKGDNSCYNVNGEILGNLAPIPKCWTCDLEHRTRGSGYIWSPKSDHWVIVCVAREEHGRKAKEMLFDYWADRPAGEDPDDWFRNRYPDYDPNEQEDFSTAHDTCDGTTYK